MDYAPLLVVEPDTATRNLLLAGLRSAGVPALGARSAYDALTWCTELVPGLVVAESRLPDVEGEELVRRIREEKPTRTVPFFFLTGDGELDLDAVESMGAQDVLHKPAFVRDLVTLAHLHGGRPAKVPVVDGRLEAVGLPHLLRLLTTGRRSGRVVLSEHAGEIRFRAGRLVAASYRDRQGEAALLRLLTLTHGAFHVSYEDVSAEDGLAMTVDDLFARGFTHVRTWEQVARTLGPLNRPRVIDFQTLGVRLGELPDAVNSVLRRFDGERTIGTVVDESLLGDLTTLRVVAKLNRMGILRSPEAAARARNSDAPTATDRLLEGLFGDAGLPALAGATAARVAVLPDWTERGEDWNAILPDVPEHEDPWQALKATEETLADLAAVDAPDLEQLGDTPVDRIRAESEAAVGAPAAEVPAADAFEDADHDFFARPATADVDPVAPRHLPVFALTLGALAVVVLVAAVLMARHVSTLAAPAKAHAKVAKVTRAAPVKAAGMVLPAMNAGPAAKTPAPAAKTVAVADLAGAATVAGPAAAKPAAKPAPPPAKPAAALPSLLDAGQKAYAAGHLADAARLYRKAIAQAPKNAVAHLGLGLALLDDGKTDAAISALKTARTLDPKAARGAVLLGTAYQLAGNRAEATKAYQDYLTLAPGGAQAKDVQAILAGWAK